VSRGFQQVSVNQGGSRLVNQLKIQPGALDNVEQSLAAVRQVKHPQHRQFELAGIGQAAKGAIETSLAKLRLAVEVLIDVTDVVLQDAEDREVSRQRTG